MNKGIGLRQCVSLLIGVMIGSAIFSISGLTMLYAGPAAALSWIAAGVISTFYGLMMAELASRYPKSGGAYVFPRYAFSEKKGKLLGWISCWASIFTNIVAIAFAAIYVGTYLSVAFPVAGNLQVPLAVAAVALCLIFNIIDFSTTGKITTVVVIALIITMLVYIGTSFGGGAYDVSLLQPFFTQGTKGTAGIIHAIPTALMAYSGIVSLAFMVSEVRDASKTVPRAMVIAMVFVTTLYVLMIVATLGLIDADYLDANPGMQYIPVFAACFTKLGHVPWLASVVSVAAVLALFSTMMVCMSMNSRLIKAAASDRQLPAFLGRENKHHVPAFGALITAVISGIVACFPGITLELINLGALLNFISIAITIIALIRARFSKTTSDFMVPGGMVISWIVLLVLSACYVNNIIVDGVKILLFTIIIMAVGLVIYGIHRKKQ